MPLHVIGVPNSINQTPYKFTYPITMSSPIQNISILPNHLFETHTKEIALQIRKHRENATAC